MKKEQRAYRLCLEHDKLVAVVDALFEMTQDPMITPEVQAYLQWQCEVYMARSLVPLNASLSLTGSKPNPV